MTAPCGYFWGEWWCDLPKGHAGQHNAAWAGEDDEL